MVEVVVCLELPDVGLGGLGMEHPQEDIDGCLLVSIWGKRREREFCTLYNDYIHQSQIIYTSIVVWISHDSHVTSLKIT